MRPKGNPEELERRRKRAYDLMKDSQPRRWISKILAVTEETLSRWKTRAEKSPNGLDSKKHQGPTPRMTERELKKLEELLLEGAVAHGWPNELWTAKRVAQLIEKKFTIHFHPEHVRKILKHQLDWSSQKPEKRAIQRNEKEVQEWIDNKLPEIKKKAKLMEAHVVFADEAGFSLSPSVRKTFAPCGSTPILKPTGFREKISAISAITISPVKEKMGLSFQLMPPKMNVQGPDVVNFLRQLKRQLGGPFIMVWDKGTIHRSKPVKAYLEKHSEIEVYHFPSYAPDLNPDEGVWKLSKGGDLANSCPRNAVDLSERLMDELYKIEKNQTVMKGLVQHAFSKSWGKIDLTEGRQGAMPATFQWKFHRPPP